MDNELVQLLREGCRLMHRKGVKECLFDRAATRIEELQTKLLAHMQNEGDECPLCVAEARIKELEHAMVLLNDIISKGDASGT